MDVERQKMLMNKKLKGLNIREKKGDGTGFESAVAGREFIRIEGLLINKKFNRATLHFGAVSYMVKGVGSASRNLMRAMAMEILIGKTQRRYISTISQRVEPTRRR